MDKQEYLTGVGQSEAPAAAPPEGVPLVRFVVDHALSVSGIAEREARGESAISSELIVKLAHPFAYVDSRL